MSITEVSYTAQMRMIAFSAAFIAFATSSANVCAAQADPRPFVSDGCTLFKEGTRKHPNLWAHCCLEHDLWLWAGGSSDERSCANDTLYECVRATGAKKTAAIMRLGVTLGRASPLKLKGKQWGNAWGDSVRDKSLSQIEIEKLKHALSKSDVDPAVQTRFFGRLGQCER